MQAIYESLLADMDAGADVRLKILPAKETLFHWNNGERDPDFIIGKLQDVLRNERRNARGKLALSAGK